LTSLVTVAECVSQMSVELWWSSSISTSVHWCANINSSCVQSL